MPEAQVVRMRDVPAVDTTLPVAWLDVGGRREVAVPVARLSEVLDFPRQKIHELAKRDPVLSSYVVTVTVTTGNIPRPTAFLLRPGVVGLLVKISTRRIKDPWKARRIQEFQRWAFDCKICNSPYRDAVDQMLLAGVGPSKVVAWLYRNGFTVSESSVGRHRAHMMSGLPPIPIPGVAPFLPLIQELSRRNLEALPTTTLAELVRLSLRALAVGKI